MDKHPTLHTMVRQSPYEARHLLIRSVDGSLVTNLIQLVSGNETGLGAGTEYEMDRKAEALMEEWAREGFRPLREPNERAWESLRETIALLSLMGYNVVYDHDYKDLRGNFTGAVPLDQWQGKQGKNGGSYKYAFGPGQTLLAQPTLPPGHGINMTLTQENMVSTMREITKLLQEVGPDYQFLLGD